MVRHAGQLCRAILIGFLIVYLAAPPLGWSAVASFGTARGYGAVELSLDEGKSWLEFGGGSLPVMEGARLRSRTGAAVLDLVDGSRLQTLPFSSIHLREVQGAVQVSVDYGRVAFRLPERTRIEIQTPSARLQPVRESLMVGEVVVSGTGITGLKMAQGKMGVDDLSGAKPVLLASRQPVFLPRRSGIQGPAFSSDIQAPPPAGAKGVFTPGGESIGYLRPDGGFVIYPGFTADLTRPFPPRLVQMAMAKVPGGIGQDPMPLFDVNGGPIGYLAGPAFYPETQVAQAVGGAAPPGTDPGERPEGGIPPRIIAYGIGLAYVGGAFGIAAAGGAFKGKEKQEARRVASPFSP